MPRECGSVRSPWPLLRQDHLRAAETARPVERGGTFERENTGVAGAEDLWGVGRELGQQAKKERSRVSTNLLYGSNDIDPDGKFLVGQKRNQMNEEAMAVQFAALDEGQGTRTAECSGGIRRSSPDWFELDVADTREEEFLFLIFKGGECLGESILGPALWVRLCLIFQKSREGRSEIWHEADQMVVLREGGGLGNDQIVPVE